MVDNYTLDTILGLIGDVPVSVQINTALDMMATKGHTHEEYSLCDEVENLKRQLNVLMSLVGDIPVSEQICAAIQNIE